MIFGLVPNGSDADLSGMADIIERNHRFYVVAYDGTDPLTGRERRRWHPAGRSRADAEAIAATLERAAAPVVPVTGTPATLGTFLPSSGGLAAAPNSDRRPRTATRG